MTVIVKSIICDDIRREDNGKLMLIGVYDQSFVPGNIPSSFPLSFWINIEGLSEGNHGFKITLNFPGGSAIETEGELEVNNPSIGNSIFLVGVPVSLGSYGEITGNIIIDREDNIKFLQIPVLQPIGNQSEQDIVVK